MSISNERMNQHIRDVLWDLEVKGDTDMAEIVVRADSPVLLAAVKRLREALTITDEMVERASAAFYHGHGEGPGFGPQWDAVCADWPEIAQIYRAGVRAALEAAFGGGES